MLINGYDTLVGKPLKIQENIGETIKMLALRQDLIPTTKPGVFTINVSNAANMPQFPLPITLTGYDKANITVYDERPFRDKNNRVLSESELNIIRLTAYTQQDAIQGDRSILLSSKFICMKAVAGGLADKLGFSKGLDLEERQTLQILLGHFVNCTFEGDTAETGYVSANAIKSVFRIDNNFSQRIIDDIGFLHDTAAVVNAIKTEPSLFKLKNLTLLEFIAVGSTLSFIGIGKRAVAVMLESPFLMIGFVYAACKHKLYSKTPIGVQLDPKYNRELVDGFIRTISYNYDLSPVN